MDRRSPRYPVEVRSPFGRGWRMELAQSVGQSVSNTNHKPGGAGLNVAVTDRFTSITTEQSVPLQSPLQPAKVEPTPGVAVKTTVLLGAKPALQIPGQDIPLGLLVTEPTPAPSIVTVSVTGEVGWLIVIDSACVSASPPAS